MAKSKKICLSKVPNSKVIANNLPNSVNDTIAWNFRYVELNHPSLKCTYRDFLKYSKLIVERFEGKSIREIEREDSSNHYWNDNAQLSKDFIEIIKSKHIEQEQFFQLRMSSKFRIFGFVRGNIFNIVCFDFNHEVYKVHKKHT